MRVLCMTGNGSHLGFRTPIGLTCTDVSYARNMLHFTARVQSEFFFRFTFTIPKEQNPSEIEAFGQNCIFREFQDGRLSAILNRTAYIVLSDLVLSRSINPTKFGRIPTGSFGYSVNENFLGASPARRPSWISDNKNICNPFISQRNAQL